MRSMRCLRGSAVFLGILMLASASLQANVEADCEKCGGVLETTSQCGNIVYGSTSSFDVPLGVLASAAVAALSAIPGLGSITIPALVAQILDVTSLSVVIAEDAEYSVGPVSCREHCCSGEQSRLRITPRLVRTGILHGGTAITGLPSTTLYLETTQPNVLDWRPYAPTESEDTDPDHCDIQVRKRTVSGSIYFELGFSVAGIGFKLPIGWGTEHEARLISMIESTEPTGVKLQQGGYVKCECQCVREEEPDVDVLFTISDDLAPSPPSLYFPTNVDIPIDGGLASAVLEVEGQGRYYYWAEPFEIPGCTDCVRDHLNPFTGEYEVEIVNPDAVRETAPWVLTRHLEHEFVVFDLKDSFEEMTLDEQTGKPLEGTYYSDSGQNVPFRVVATGGIDASARDLDLTTQGLADAQCSISITLEACAETDNDSRVVYADFDESTRPLGWSLLPLVPSERIVFERQEKGTWIAEIGFLWAGGICSGFAHLAPKGSYVFEFLVYEVVDPFDASFGADDDYRDRRQTMSNAQSVVATVTISNSPPVARNDYPDNIGPTGDILSTVTVDVVDNDEDPDGDALTARLDSQPAHGTARLSDLGVFVYTPDAGFYGIDTFTYYAVDASSQSTNTATVTVTVHPGAVNQAPSLYVESPERTSCPDSPSEVQDCYRMELTVADPDFFQPFFNEILTVSASFSQGSRGEFWLQGFGESLWPDGTAEVRTDELGRGAIVVKLDRSIAEHVIRLQAVDRSGMTDSVSVKLHTSSADPQVSFDGGETWLSFERGYYDGTLVSNEPYRFTMEPDWYEVGCLQFRDLDGDNLTFRITQHPTKGTVDLHPTRLGPGRYAVTVSYEVYRERMLECHRNRTPLVDVIEVTARDSSGGTAVAQMNINFEVVNTPPTCADDSATTPSGVPVTIDVLDNDSDPDEDVLTIVEVSVPAGGGAAIVNDEIVYTPDPNVCGEDTFSYTVDDDYGGQATAWVTVDVTDTEDPVAICQTATLYLDANGTATLDPASLNDNSTDNCSIATFDASEKTFNCGMLGDRPVMLTVYDSAGNSDSCWTTVSVLDKINPVAVGQDITVQLDASGSVTVQASEINGGSTDNCSVTTVLIDGNVEKVFSCGDIGAKTVSLTVRDQSGNEHSVDVMVTVEDPIAPVAQCQDIIASLDINGEVTVAASSIDNGSTDNCSIASMTLDRDFFTEADIGDQTVTLTVEDASGNTDSCTAVVTVQDNMAPDIDCPGAKFVQVDLNRCYATGVDLGMPTATDNTEVDWLTLTNNAPSQFQVGTTAVKWAVSDIYGNVGQCFQQVTVTESVDPTVSCPGDIDVDTGDPTGTTVTFAASATDNCDPSPEITFSPTSGSHFPIGDTVVTVTATDDSGNTDTCTFTVSVNFQNSPPNAVNDSASLAQGEGYVDIPVLNNDRDPEGHDLTITDVGDPQCGITTIIGDEIRYGTLGCASLPDEVTFTYEITDEHGATDTAVVTVDLPGGAPLNNND